MNLARIFASAIARRVAVVIVALVFAWLGVGTSHAQTTPNPGGAGYLPPTGTCSIGGFNYGNCTTQEAAYQQIMKGYPQTVAPNQCGVQGGVNKPIYYAVQHLPGPKAYSWRFSCNLSTQPFPNGVGGVPNASFSYATPCGAGEDIDTATGKCVNLRERCLNKNDALPSSGTAIYTGQKCNDGCAYGMRPGSGTSTANGTTILYGTPGYTGDTCASADPPPDIKPETCTTPTGTALTMCVKDDGRHCYSASTGRQICWGPGETGTKTDGDVAQKRGPGADKPPAPTPPTGETFNDSNKPTTTTTTTPGGTVINNTTNNWTTGNGTDAGDDNQGEAPGDEGEGDEGNASGGEGCDLPPTCSGDSVGCASLVMIWRNRCSEGRNKVEGGGECDANGQPLLVCTGDQVACKAMLLEAEQHCAAKKADTNNDGQPDWTVPGEGDGTEGAGEDPGEDVGKVQTASFGAPVLDETGLSWSRACPDLGTLNLSYFGSFDLNSVPWICDFTTMVRGVFFLLGSFLALMIVMGWKGF